MICIFTPSEVERLMCTAQSMTPNITYLALGIFAGIRPDEIMRLEWKDISPTESWSSAANQDSAATVCEGYGQFDKWLIPGIYRSLIKGSDYRRSERSQW